MSDFVIWSLQYAIKYSKPSILSDLRVFEIRVLRRLCGPRREKWREVGEYCIMRSFIKCTPSIVRAIKSEVREAWDM
jgi:hypothetical protein